MPSFTFTSPEGKKYTVNGPEGSTKEQAFEMLQKQLGTPKAETPKQEIMPQERLTWGDVPLEAVKNLPSSLGNIVSGIGSAIAHPIDTASGIGKLALGTSEKAGGGLVNKAVGLFNPELVAFNERIRTPSEPEKMASAVGGFYANRYGSEEGIKNALARDPAGVAADLATVLSAGGGLASKFGATNKLGQSMSTLATKIDPASLMVKGVEKGAPYVGGKVADVIGGLGTHTGGESLRQAAKAGFKGGTTAESFLENMRGNVAATDVLNDVKANIAELGRQKADAYRQGMAQVSSDKSILDFKGIDDAINNASSEITFKGQIKNQRASEELSKVSDAINKWKNLDPVEYHTPEGLDALKQNIGDILEGIPYDQSSARKVVGNIYHSIKNEITKQAPVYAETMKNYTEASDQIKEIEQALSQGKKASADTAMRKLQSLMRNNVNTNYGNRLELAKQLESAGGTEFMPALAGQSLNTITPRGLGGAVAGGFGLGGYAVGGLPVAAAVLAAQSPRLMGEAAYYTGKAAKGVSMQADQINKLAQIMKVNPEMAANYLYQANQLNQQGR